MGESADVSPLLMPYKLGSFQLQRRMIYAPLTRSRALGKVTQPAAVTYYSQRASPGIFMLTEGTTISDVANGYPNTPGIYTKEQMDAWRPVVDAVHEKGAIFFLQLWHCGRASHQLYQPDGRPPPAPSTIAVNDGTKLYLPDGSEGEYPVPREMTVEDIKGVIEEYRQAARNAVDVGFDGVEIHGANGYIIDEFIKDGMNKRTDDYGGTPEKRARFCLEVVAAVTEEVGVERVGMRLSPFGGFLDATDSDPYVTNLLIIDELNKKYPLLYLHMIEPRVVGNSDREESDVPKDQTLKPFRCQFKNVFIAAGGFKKESGEKALEIGDADLICYGRLWLSNPDLPRRFELGSELNKYDRATFYSPDQVKGYTDYPFLEESKSTTGQA
eukprot:SM000037S13538  [mRNA]  locus=s37:559232:561869:+ [translate_table: standard]